MLAIQLATAVPAAATAETPLQTESASGRGGDFEPPVAARDWTSIVLHHSATDGGSVESIDAVHRRQKDAEGNHWLGIGYHFVVGNGDGMGDGEIRATFRWQKQLSGAHAGRREQNEHGIGICLIGNFDRQAPTEKQIAAARGLVKTLAGRYKIGRGSVLRHQDVTATLCPGRLFPGQQVLADLPPPKGS
jgi:hypothetical protein